MTNVAILGFGVVGGGVADLLIRNRDCVTRLGGDEVRIKYILDLRDFPTSPLASLVVHDYEIILSDPEVNCVIEAMGGSHPAYEYTVAALKAGKSVITSNKEVVATFGDEFLSLAREMGVCYRFEAAVGGGIPVISPMISFVLQNRITEIRGILNGTTNYILTNMFGLGASFDEALRDAQERGYAERNPDADVLGTDACRKIAILTAIATGRLLLTDKIHTEGITAIRHNDVKAAESVNMCIKLLGRCILTDGGMQVMVAPFMIKDDSMLASVRSVYNAVEVIGEPIGSIMFYGQGAGAGATASAVVGDLMQIMRSGRSYAEPIWEKTEAGLVDFESFTSRNYIALSGADNEDITKAFGRVQMLSSEGEVAFITESISEGGADTAIRYLSSRGINLLSRIRLL